METPQGIIDFVKEHGVVSDDKEFHRNPHLFEKLDLIEILSREGEKEPRLVWIVLKGVTYEMLFTDYLEMLDTMEE